MTVLPRFIGKQHAVQYLVEQNDWASELVLALGDSLSDAGFMGLADYAMMPNASRLAAWLHSSVVTSGEQA